MIDNDTDCLRELKDYFHSIFNRPFDSQKLSHIKEVVATAIARVNNLLFSFNTTPNANNNNR